MSHRLRLSAALIGLCLTAFSLPSFADPPSRVGRISGVDGAVTVTGLDTNAVEMATVTVNYPVAAGMRFSSLAGSRAEMDFGTLSARIDGRTDVEIQTLDDTTVGFRLTLGSIDVRVRALGDGERITVGTSDGQVVLTKSGAYRIDAPGSGASSAGDAPFRAMTHVAVFEGAAQLHSPHGSDDVFAGEAVDIDSPHGTLRYGRADSIWLDDWASGREQEIAAAAADADRYVDTDIAGVDQLSDAGGWEETPDYGAVWYPDSVPDGWAPYEYGSWEWVAPWGWTWIDDQPWGFAPFHYGRWLRVHGRWGWSPGERHHHHVYAPALVTFVGDQHHDQRVRPNGWVPLAPGEAYMPPYAHGGNYMRDLNSDGRHWSGNGGARAPDHNTNGVVDDTHHNAVITTTMRLPPGSNSGGENNGDHRHRRTGNDDRAPINITDDTFKRRPQPSVLAPTGGVTPMTANPAGSPTNPVGNPPSGPGPSPLAPRIDQTLPNQNPGQDGDRRGFWVHRNPDIRNAGPQSPSATVAAPGVHQPAVVPPQAITAPPSPVDVGGYGQFRPPRTGNLESVPADAGGYTRFPRPNPAGAAPQIPSTPVQTFQPPTPIQVPQPMAVAPPPQSRSVDVPGVGRVQVPANAGQGNTGRGNAGQGSTGQGNAGQGNVGQPTAGGNYGR